MKFLYESNQNTNPFTNQDKSILADVQTRAHSHKNREILDQYSVPNDAIQKAADTAHVHPNSEIIGKIVSLGSGKIITESERSALEELIAMLPKLRECISKSY